MEDAFLQVDTPENVFFNYEVAGIGSRFMAALVDSILIFIIQIVISGLLGILGLFRQLGESGAAMLYAVILLISFLMFWGYYLAFEMIWNGQTPGKRWVHLRVIKADGTPVTLSEVVIRNVIRLIDFMPGMYAIGVVTMFIDARSRRLGDLAAGTLVIREQSQLSLKTPPMVHARTTITVPMPADPNDRLPVERLTGQDLLMAEDFLRRRYELPDSHTLAWQILRALFIRMEMSEARLTEMPVMQWIERIVREAQSRQEEI